MAKKYKVTTPNTGFSGVRAGVKFKNGSADVSKAKAEGLLKKYPDYSCPELDEKSDDDQNQDNPDPKPKAIADYRKQILLDTAKAVLNCDYVDRIHKDDLVTEIKDDLAKKELEDSGIREAFMAHAQSLDK